MTRNVNIKTAGSNPSQVCEGTLEQKEDGSSLLTSHCADGSYSVAHAAPQKIVNGQDMSHITRGSLKNNEDGSYLATSTNLAGGYSVDYRAPGNTTLEEMNGQLTGRPASQDEVVSAVSNLARSNNIEGLSWSRSTDGSNAMIASDGHGSKLRIEADGSISGGLGGGRYPELNTDSVGGGRGGASGAFGNLAKSLQGSANVSGSVSSNVSAGEDFTASWPTDGHGSQMQIRADESISDSVGGGRGGAYEQRTQGGNSADQNKGAQAETADAGMGM
jgi:hypothetical protein